MGRGEKRPVGLPPSGNQAAIRHNEQLKRSKPEYRVQMEQVTQKKKKLLSMPTYKVQAPLGYTFIPLTAPELTDLCKDLARKLGAQVHVVSVGRVGHHFPSQLVSQALAEQGYDIDRSGRILSDLKELSKDFGSEAARRDQKGTRIGEGVTDSAQIRKIQEQLNSDASKSLTTLFPDMPEKDKKAVIKHAFIIGKERIGTSAELSMDRRVHLAVLAHIRHAYTDYDKLLKQVPYQTARSIVERKTLQKIVEWRGEEDNDEAVEEILREVIVIDDDDDDPKVGHISLIGEEDDEIQFRSSPIAVDKIDSRPHLNSHLPYDNSREICSDTGRYILAEPDSRSRVWDTERRRRYDDRMRSMWQEAKRTYREAVPITTNHPMREPTRIVPSGQVEILEPIHTQYRPREAPGCVFVDDRSHPGVSRPQIVMLKSAETGQSHENKPRYSTEVYREVPRNHQRTSSQQEIIHQSIEESSRENRKSLQFPEVIALDSPPNRSTGIGRQPYPNSDTSNFGNIVERHEITYERGLPNSPNQIVLPRKRTLDETTHREPAYFPTAHAKRVVQLSNTPHDNGVRKIDSSPSKVRTIEYVPHQQVAVRSPLNARFEPKPDPGIRMSGNLHFYQNARPAQPSHPISYQYESKVFPSTQYTELPYESRQNRPSVAQLNNPSSSAAGPVYSVGQQPPIIRDDQVFVRPPQPEKAFGREDVAGEVLGHDQYARHVETSNVVASSRNAGFRAVEQPRPANGVHQHLQNLHFYEAPRPEIHAPPQRYYDTNGREIVMSRRTNNF